MQQNLTDTKIPYKTKEIYNGYSIFTSMKTTLSHIQKKKKNSIRVKELSLCCLITCCIKGQDPP